MAEPILQLEAFLPYRLAQAAETVSRDFSALYGDRYGMTRPEWRVFATIGQFGRITAKAIGTHSALHKTKVSRAVHALERRHWVTRTPDEADRRVEHLELTRQGRRCYADMVGVAKSYEARLIGELGKAAAAKLDAGIAAIEKRNHR
jgi:DNA-binding MarR family transcriptional regulator